MPGGDAQPPVGVFVAQDRGAAIGEVVGHGALVGHGERLQRGAVRVELPHEDEQIHVIGTAGLDPQVGLGVADHDRFLVEAGDERHRIRVGGNGVGRRHRIGRRVETQST